MREKNIPSSPEIEKLKYNREKVPHKKKIQAILSK